ncbi:MAG: hypothetical protein KC421_08910, partial [Anaerolineales bacterium]|nr:hypothetical protein [Anaerolineales bacterium]
MQRLKRIGRQIKIVMRVMIVHLWRFMGRVGLAIRKLLTWFLWTPLIYVTMPVWLPLRWMWEIVQPVFPIIWRFIGRMGLALRRLLTWGIWRPFDFLLRRPFLWLYHHGIRPFSRWLIQKIGQILGRLWGLVRRTVAHSWAVTAPRRHLLRRRLRSHWTIWRARWHLRWIRPSLPNKAEIAPAAPRLSIGNPRLMRLATAFATIAVLLIVGIISVREPQADAAAGDAAFSVPEVIILTPTPLPPTLVPTPTTEIILTPWPTP